MTLTWGHRAIRLIVLNRIADHPRSARQQLLPANWSACVRSQALPANLSQQRCCCYHLASHHLERPDTWLIPSGISSDTLRLVIEDVDQFTPEERAALLERMDAEDRLRGLPTEDRLRGLPTEDRLRGLPTEEILRVLPPEEILSGLDPDVIKAWLERTGH